jgi:DNA cross-link repair 1A protein
MVTIVKYCFPPQPLVVEACAELARRVANGEPLDDIDTKPCGSKGSNVKKATMSSWLQILPSKDKGKAPAFVATSKSDVLVVVGYVHY